MEKDVQTLTARFEEGECFYAILSVKKDASATEIRKAYHKLALQFHPDRVQGDDAARARAKSEFQTLGRIYETLSVEEKRKFYDETGSIEHDDFLSSSEDKNWDEYWRLLFKKVTSDDIENYAKSFKGSELEASDVKQAYVDHEGNMERIIDTVVLSSWDDEDRFRAIIDAAIKAGEVPTFDEYEASAKKKQNKKRTTAAARRRKAQEEEEAKEAEELAQKMGLRAGGKKGGDDALKQMILQNKGKSETRFNSVIANLEAKYGGKKETKKKGAGRKGKKQQQQEEEELNDEPTEEEFLALRKKLEEKKSKPEEKARSRKKRRIEQDDEEVELHDDNEPTEEEFEQARKRLEEQRKTKAAAATKKTTQRGAAKTGARGGKGRK
ncbi:DnaJ domain containing protein [Acanthamoeba castellanii str. Neff]|uniref:DnaJ domain containing protein n=1 Tax=Acanthamoeba castellanii (strain ATCC 30010 / Neff) TaxID=1257118 RepID=L8GX97_ACACF|nr:DnaJ domain containing protein [Acanthamoeba castellanii str. Neff]ELR17899.1 DnaJ domain containing protein [Acanthamoeba castellanii str. Neff]